MTDKRVPRFVVQQKRLPPADVEPTRPARPARIVVSQSKGQPGRRPQRLTGGIGTDVTSGDLVTLPYDDRPRGVALVGKAGTGKSSLLERLILDDLERRIPGMVIDPHGLLAERVMQYATADEAERIILLEAVRSAPFGLNLLDVREPLDENDDPVSWAADSVVATIKKLYGQEDEFLPRLERYLDLSARTLIPSRLTLLDAPRLFQDTSFRQSCLSRVADRREQESLRTSWAAYDKLRPGEQITHTEALVNRLERLLAPPVIQRIVGSRETTVPFDRILQGDSMLLVSLPSDRLSPERCDFIGAMLLCGLADRIFARNVTRGEPRQLHIYLDEYQRFATVTTAELLEQGRKYRAGVTMAHQSLQQIREARIRDAARHAGTLIVLGVTRPDAEELAGEFPIKPKEEWVETVEEVDGTEPKLVPSPTPAEDLYLNGHSNQDVDRIVRSFFAETPRWTMRRIEKEGKFRLARRAPNRLLGAFEIYEDASEFDGDPRKTAGVPARPCAQRMHPRAQLTPYDVNDLLVEAMQGRLTDPDAFLMRIIQARPWSPHVRIAGRAIPVVRNTYSTMYYLMSNNSPSLFPQPYCECPPIDPTADRRPELFTIGPQRPRAFDDPLGEHLLGCGERALTKKQTEHNNTVNRIYWGQANEFVSRHVLRWLWEHVMEDPRSLRTSTYTEAFRRADERLIAQACLRCWGNQWEWTGRVAVGDDGVPKAVPYPAEDLQAEINRRAAEYAEMVEYARQRVRVLHYLCEAIEKEPLLINSGEQKPRMRTRHIVHGGQTHADALNEFAGQLVHPPKRYVAHVRLPHGYHLVQLGKPLGGGADDRGRVPDPNQPAAIRTKSRELCVSTHVRTSTCRPRRQNRLVPGR